MCLLFKIWPVFYTSSTFRGRDSGRPPRWTSQLEVNQSALRSRQKIQVTSTVTTIDAFFKSLVWENKGRLKELGMSRHSLKLLFSYCFRMWPCLETQCARASSLLLTFLPINAWPIVKSFQFGFTRWLNRLGIPLNSSKLGVLHYNTMFRIQDTVRMSFFCSFGIRYLITIYCQGPGQSLPILKIFVNQKKPNSPPTKKIPTIIVMKTC